MYLGRQGGSCMHTLLFFPSPLGICSSFPQQAQWCESVPVALLASAKGTGRGLKRPAAPTEPSKPRRAAQKGISLKGPSGFACPTDSGYFPVNPFGPWGKAHSVKGDGVTWDRDKPWGSTSPGWERVTAPGAGSDSRRKQKIRLLGSFPFYLFIIIILFPGNKCSLQHSQRAGMRLNPYPVAECLLPSSYLLSALSRLPLGKTI